MAKGTAPLERDIQSQCLAYLHLRGFLVWRANSGRLSVTRGGRRRVYRFAGVDGLSDVIGLLPDGRFIGIEFKRPGNEPTEQQQAFLDRVKASGGVALVVSSVEQLRQELAEAGFPEG